MTLLIELDLQSSNHTFPISGYGYLEMVTIFQLSSALMHLEIEVAMELYREQIFKLNGLGVI